jgi:hypothetical protein
MTQSVYYQRVKVDACCSVTSSLPGIYKSLTDYCNNNPLNYCNYLSINCLQIAMCFHQQTDYQHHSIYLKSYI